MRTTEDVRELELYVSSCCGAALILGEDNCFSRCPRCERLCEWELVQTLISWEKMEHVSDEHAA